jgi:Protein of unknown function (DUF1254)
MQTDDDVLLGAQRTYNVDPAQWVDDWVDTIDPRNAASGQLVRMPFRLFPRQFELIDFFHSCLEAEANGLVEKSRDMGATWAAISYAVWLFLFRPGASVGFGSRKAQLVDRIGDMDSIFEKIRHCITSLPPMFQPKMYDASYMKFTGPGWKGKVPTGMTQIKSPTRYLVILGRTYADGTDQDFAIVRHARPRAGGPRPLQRSDPGRSQSVHDQCCWWLSLHAPIRDTLPFARCTAATVQSIKSACPEGPAVG